MACDINANFTLADFCKEIGGASTVYVTKFLKSYSTSWGLTGSYTNIVTSWGGATPSWYKIEQPAESINFTAAGETNATNAAIRPSVTFVIPGFNANSNGYTTVLYKGFWLVAVEDLSGKIHLATLKSPMSSTALTSGLGQAILDPAASTLTLAGVSAEISYEINTALFQAAVHS